MTETFKPNLEFPMYRSKLYLFIQRNMKLKSSVLGYAMNCQSNFTGQRKMYFDQGSTKERNPSADRIEYETLCTMKSWIQISDDLESCIVEWYK